MSRRPFNGLVLDDQGNAQKNVAAAGTAWDSKTGGSQVSDLLDNLRGGSNDGFLSTDANGEFDFQGPASGTGGVWVDFGAGRFFVEAADTTSRLDALESATSTMLQSSDFGVTTTGVPGPLDGSGYVPATQLNPGTVAVLDANGNVPSAIQSPGVPFVAQYGVPTPGAYPLRSALTADATACVMWKGPVDPTFASGFAIGGVDVWIQET